MTARRSVRPEALDELDPDDPRAKRSRRDLKRVHRAMLSLWILKHALSRLRLAEPPKTILELGAGDGSLALRLASALDPRWLGVDLTLLDRQRAVDPKTLDDFRTLGWQASVLCEDALAWAATAAAKLHDLCFTTLFLHHFQDQELRMLLNGVAARTNAFIAVEPRRETLAKVGSHLIGLLGTNSITREDSIKSVAAGFAAEEITAAWPTDQGKWRLQEFRALPFLHVFIAARENTRRANP